MLRISCNGDGAAAFAPDAVGVTPNSKRISFGTDTPAKTGRAAILALLSASPPAPKENTGMKRDATPAPEGEQPTAKRARITGKVAKAGTDTPVKTGRAACPKHEATSPPAHTAKAAAAAKAAAVAKARAVAKEPPAATPKKTEAAEPAAAAEAEPPVTTAAAEAEAKAEREAKQAAEKQAREARQVAEKATREAAAKKAKEDAAAVPEPPSQLSTPSGQPMKMEELGKSVVAQAASKDATDVAATDVAEDKVQKRKNEARL